MRRGQPEVPEAGARDPADGCAPTHGILIVDDEPPVLESLELTLAGEHRIFAAQSAEAALAILEDEDIALIIADQVLPSMSGVEFLERAVEIAPTAIRVMLSGQVELVSLVRAINDGHIHRYIEKPWEPDALRRDVRRALEDRALAPSNAPLASALADANARLRAENSQLRGEIERRYAFEEIIGSSPAMKRVFEVMETVAGTDAPVLITGEPGTGVDLVARAIHYRGHRRQQHFAAQNCAALPDALLEGELFGHLRGAFTGASADKIGLFEQVHRGTLLLDEVGETSSGVQVRLLRALQDGEIRPLGSSETRAVDVRIIAATRRDLLEETESGRFREDLYHRLRVVEIELPPLRERRSDIPALARHFLELANRESGSGIEGFTHAAMDRLVAYRWSGNVRELRDEVERAVALHGDSEAIGVEMLSEPIRGAAPLADPRVDEVPLEMTLNAAVDALKRRMIQDALRATGSKTRAAERLGIPRQSLQKMVKRLGLVD
jgi:two-component system response regulator HupR/HoxA